MNQILQKYDDLTMWTFAWYILRSQPEKQVMQGNGMDLKMVSKVDLQKMFVLMIRVLLFILNILLHVGHVLSKPMYQELLNCKEWG